MKLYPEMWDKLYTYLVYDKKHDDSRKNVQRRKSTFLIMCKYFADKDFTRENFNLFIRYLLEKGYSKEYANSFIKLAKHIDAFLKSDQLKDYSLFPKTPKVIDWLSYDEIRAMADVHIPYKTDSDWKNLKYKCLIMTLLLTGARISEVLSLRWENIRDNPYCLIFEENKTNELRISPISKDLFELLHSLPKYSGYIFSNQDGNCLDYTAINDELKRRALAVGIKKRVYNHLLRHSFVNIMLREGTPMHIVSRMVGHKDISTTNEYYTHIMLQEMSDFLHTYHPHLKDHQTLATIRKRLQGFVETFINKDKFSLDVHEKNKVITVKVEER